MDILLAKTKEVLKNVKVEFDFLWYLIRFWINSIFCVEMFFFYPILIGHLFFLIVSDFSR